MTTSSHSDPQRLGKYELRERLGRGSIAEVWKAFDTQLQRSIALKILYADLLNDPHFIARFEHETQVIASLHHPNIVRVYDFHLARPPESESTLAYIVMDYVEGMTLSEYIRNTSRMGKFPSPTDIVQICTGVQPFQGESMPAIMLQHINSMPPLPDLMNPNIPPALTHVILRCLAKDPAARFNNASIIVASVAEAFGIPLPAEPVLPTPSQDVLSGPPSLSPRPSSLLPGMIPTTPSMPMSTPGQPPNDASSS